MMVTAKGNGNGAGQREITAEYHDAAQVGLTKASGQPEGIIFGSPDVFVGGLSAGQRRA